MVNWVQPVAGSASDGGFHLDHDDEPKPVDAGLHPIDDPIMAPVPAMPKPRSRLGRLLVDNDTITEDDLAEALAEQSSTGKPLGKVLLDLGKVNESQLAQALAEQFGLSYVDIVEHGVDARATMLVSESLCRGHQVMPIAFDGERLVLAMADPGNIVALDDIRTLTRRRLTVVVATPSDITAAMARYHRLDSEAEDVSAEAAHQFEENDELSSIREVVEDAPVVKLVNLLINQAAVDRASDIHIEPGERDVRVRYRIDGVLHEAMRLQKSVSLGVASRLKIMADLNISERRLPQDGRISVSLGGHPVDLRVATLPTVHGEKIVLRILDKSTALLKLSDLGFLPESLERFSESYRRPYGTILVTGPTGSGKSTTLYATINLISDVTRNVITVEDPVEYRLAGINQIQVHARAGLTFATALRSILRSDPDVVLVGEIRDAETARIAIEAALTGHLVLSTLHTNDASSTPDRLVEMGVEPFLVGSALSCIVAQRLARRLCDKCKKAQRFDPGELTSAGWDMESMQMTELPDMIFKPVGCNTCGRTGYRGRFGIHEVMNITEELERMIVDRAHSEELRRAAIASGMWTLRRTGLAHVLSGNTTFEEVLRVVA
jgi:type IV pilus assembly protein PilB